MIKKLELDKEAIKRYWKNDPEYVKKVIDMLSVRCREFKRVPCYYVHWLDAYINCFKGYTHITNQILPIDYGYGLNPSSIQKYLKSTYPDEDPDTYIVSIGVMSMDYEKYYKNGTFINLDGVDTESDFYEMENWEELAKKAYIEGKWLTYAVYKLPEPKE